MPEGLRQQQLEAEAAAQKRTGATSVRPSVSSIHYLSVPLMIMHLQADVRAGPFMFITVLQDLQKNCVWKCVGK